MVQTYSNNKKHGNGIYTWANGNVYVGEWKTYFQHHPGPLPTTPLEHFS